MGNLISHIKNILSPFPKVKSVNGLGGLEKADVLFHNLVAEKKVPGLAVTILEDGQTILEKGYGFANLAKRRKVYPQRTVFRVASISKCITGLALGKMVEDGVVDLDESFYTYVPYYPKKKYDFTLRQLASHTAGIRGYRGKEFAMNQDFSIKESVAIFKDDPLFFEPGKGYLYNSFDFVLLSLAMQEAGGVPFAQYVREQILMPLGLKNTIPPQKNVSSSLSTTLKINSQVENKTEFYTRTSLGFKKAVEVNNAYKLAGGGYLSTSEEVAKLGQAIMEKKLLKDATYQQLLTSQIIDGKPTHYGLGFQVSQDVKGRSFVGHVGNSVGAYTNFFVYPKEEKVISILINCTDPKVQEVLDMAISSIVGDGT